MKRRGQWDEEPVVPPQPLLHVTRERPLLLFGFARPAIYVPRNCSVLRKQDDHKESS